MLKREVSLMKPIINPWIVYVINMIDNFGPVIWVAFLVLSIVLVIYVIYLMDVKDKITNYEHRYKDAQLYNDKLTENESKRYLEKYNLKEKTCIKTMKKITVSFAIVIVLLVLIPSRETMYTMFTLHYVTEDNIKMVGDSAQDVVDYIFDKVEEITDNNSDNTNTEDVEHSTDNK